MYSKQAFLIRLKKVEKILSDSPRKLDSGIKMDIDANDHGKERESLFATDSHVMQAILKKRKTRISTGKYSVIVIQYL